MSESGHSQPSYGNGWSRKKKRYRDVSRDQDYYESSPANMSHRESYSTYGKETGEDQEKSHSNLSQPSGKPPVILTKPGKPISSSGSAAKSSDTSGSWQEVATSPSTAIAPKLSMTFSRSPQNIGSEKKFSKSVIERKYSGATSPNVVKQSLNQGGPNAPGTTSITSSIKSKEISSSKTVKVLDASLHWSDEAMELLQDQNDFMVVGVIGMQGVGKSTVLSLIAGNHLKDGHKLMLFKQQTPEVRERASHMTTGIDIAITSERIILLDAQPILSPSLLEQCIHYDRKSTSDYAGSSSIEIQSLQIAAFLLTACHVIIVVQDWFTDSYIYKFLQTAEMLKPVTTPPSHDSNSAIESDQTDIQPVLVFVHNKVDSNMFNIRTVNAMNEVMSNLVKFSSVHCRGYFSLAETNLYPGLASLCLAEKEMNAFLLPNVNENENQEKCDVTKITNDPADRMFLSMPQFVGRPNTSILETTFRKMILSMPRHQLTRLPLTEKNWFHYAARSWETIRKSQLVSEYNRLLSG